MRVQIIAELGSVPDGSVGQACALATAAIRAGADCIKTQDHRWQDVPSGARHPRWMQYPGLETRAAYVARVSSWTDGDWGNFSIVVRELEKQHIVSPFSCESLAWHLDAKTIDGIKIASGQATNAAMLAMARESGIPVYLSCGMTTWSETKLAMVRLTGKLVPTLLQCTSRYPCPPEEVGLKLLRDMGNQTDIKYGLSDHTLGMAASLAAITLGATVIERHVCWDRRGYGSDCNHSLTIDEFSRFCSEVRDLEKMLGSTLTKDDVVRTMGSVRDAFLHREDTNDQGNRSSDGTHAGSVR